MGTADWYPDLWTKNYSDLIPSSCCTGGMSEVYVTDDKPKDEPLPKEEEVKDEDEWHDTKPEANGYIFIAAALGTMITSLIVLFLWMVNI